MSRAATGLVMIGLAGAWAVAGAPAARAAGKVKGNAGGIERGVILVNGEGGLRGWTVTGPSGRYEFGGLDAGEYMMLIDGKICPRVQVADGVSTIVDQATQPKFDLEKELWTPPRVRFAQSFVATGTAVSGFSLWMPSGHSKLRVSLYEQSPSGRRVAGPYETEKEMLWICGSSLPSEAFVTEIGRTYALELVAANGEPWTHAAPRVGDVYPDGIAFYDGVAHPESDLGITIDMVRPGLPRVAGAREDLHFIAEGPGSGRCKVAGQTFVATTPNIINAYANCGWGAGIEDFIFTIREDGPGGEPVGPPCEARMVSDWGSDALWFPDAVAVTPGQQYYLEYRRVDGEPFFSYLSKDVYKQGRAYRDGKMLPEQFDQLFGVRGEAEPDSVIYPYDVQVRDMTDTSATIVWRTGTQGDGVVDYGTTRHLTSQAGSVDTRATEHEVRLTGLAPGTVYMYRASSHTHKASSRRIYSRIYDFMTQPGGPDAPRFAAPAQQPAPPACDDCVAMVNPGFDGGLTGWSRKARLGRAKEPERYVPNADPFGDATAGIDGYAPHSGAKMYGWSYFGTEDKTWTEPREDWKREIVYQRITVEPGRPYVLSAWLLTGDRASGWGRDSRVRLAVDEQDAGRLEDFDTIQDANVTQWFATQHQWLPVSLHFKPTGEHVTIGVEFLSWWALEANHLYVDELSVRPAD